MSPTVALRDGSNLQDLFDKVVSAEIEREELRALVTAFFLDAMDHDQRLRFEAGRDAALAERKLRCGVMITSATAHAA